MGGLTLQNYSWVPAQHRLRQPGASDRKLPSLSLDQLCWDWFLPHRKQKWKPELGQKTASLIRSCQLQLVSSFPSLLTPVPCPLWPRSYSLSHTGPVEVCKRLPCGHNSTLYFGMVLGSRLRYAEQQPLAKKWGSQHLLSLFYYLWSTFSTSLWWEFRSHVPNCFASGLFALLLSTAQLCWD